jgi:protein-tyrosine phosphatase
VIDLHTHVLPGLDDGPSTIGESLALARAAAVEGTRTLAATPHLRHDHPNVRVEVLADRCGALGRQLEERDIPLRVVSGAEVDYEWALAASAEELRLASYGQRGSDLLLEIPYAPITPAFDGALFRLAGLGFRVLLAHPERNPTFQRDPERLEGLVRRGALVQLTADSLLDSGLRRRPAARLAVRLVERGLTHALASDAHAARGRRSPELRGGVAAADRIRSGRGTWMVTDAAAAILAGEPLPRAPAARGVRWPSFRRARPR